jgi:hypothetical protein
MRTALVAALLGSSALLGLAPLPAAAQGQPQVTPDVVPAGQAQAKAAIASCDRLTAYLEQARPAGAVSTDQVRTWLQASDGASCQKELDRLAEANRPAPAAGASPPAPATGTTPPPTASAMPPASPSQAAAPAATATASAAPPADAPPPAGPVSAMATGQPVAAGGAAPQVVVQQAQPSVTVRQAQPEIIVRQGPPIITVQQPQPEIIVRMPEPDVNVAMAQPQVQVSIPQPQVQVQPPAPQSQANVQVERQQPNVRFERTGEPQIVYKPAEGQPQIRYEAIGAAGQTVASNAAPAAGQPTPAMSQQGAQAQLNGGQPGYGTSAAAENAAVAANPLTTGAIPAVPTANLQVSRLEDMTLYNAREEKLGEVDAVVAGPGGRTFAVVSYGGFLGLGERRVAIPMEQLAMRQDRLLADGLTDEQLKALPDFDRNAGYRDVDDNQSAQLRVLR